ncbi:hypothetical protein K4L06_21530 [Lysobacter sp. BMK333-48F3]|uniref:hypothetical protein n=1 Tax=Lysobacter sp. BMK333-48F3 TaxID=2867962 RepID=UPI001C8CF1A2|nr:hypothetical protein [Lysobacter sp. BMK333-48F3]MBX9403889.1 hypothetical protein [Lysobacter sp. BMK333-48F3]
MTSRLLQRLRCAAFAVVALAAASASAAPAALTPHPVRLDDGRRFSLNLPAELEIVPVEKITPTDWTVDQAMSFIISGDTAPPEMMKLIAWSTVQSVGVIFSTGTISR